MPLMVMSQKSGRHAKAQGRALSITHIPSHGPPASKHTRPAPTGVQGRMLGFQAQSLPSLERVLVIATSDVLMQLIAPGNLGSEQA